MTTALESLWHAHHAPSKLPPHQPCFALFRGVRKSTRPGFVELINAPVQVVEVWNGAVKELAVALCGRATRWPLGAFEGEWQVLDCEPSA